MRTTSAAIVAFTMFIPLHDAKGGHTETVLYSFCSQTNCSDGSSPVGRVVADSAGNFYGVTEYGGDASCNCGVVFRLTPRGSEKVLHTFIGGNDGAGPLGGLVMDASGRMYGTTTGGGGSGGTCGGACGTVFRVDSTGKEKVVYAFPGGDSGGNPQADLAIDANDNVYGITPEDGKYGFGTVFEVKPNGTEAVLHAFTDQNDGAFPNAGVLRDAKGNLFGTTIWDPVYGAGTVFRLTRRGKETPLYTFTNGSDGGLPESDLMEDQAGNLYGTTFWMGLPPYGQGVVFKVAPDGTETVLYTFCAQGNCSDGANPLSSLVTDASGDFYGTTEMGGANNLGTVFRLTPAGKETVLHSFGGTGDGSYPISGLMELNGWLYGTTAEGGANGTGVFFKVKE